MRKWETQSHVRWYCRYHVVFVPKYRKKVIYGSLRRNIGTILRKLCQQSKIELVEGHAVVDHVHLCLSIPPKFSVANTVGFLKGKSAIRIHREHLGRRRNFMGFYFWARGYLAAIEYMRKDKPGAAVQFRRKAEKALRRLRLEIATETPYGYGLTSEGSRESRASKTSDAIVSASRASSTGGSSSSPG